MIQKDANSERVYGKNISPNGCVETLSCDSSDLENQILLKGFVIFGCIVVAVSPINTIYWFAEVALTEYSRPGGLCNTSSLSHSSEDQKSKIGVLQNWFLQRLWGMNVFQAFLFGMYTTTFSVFSYGLPSKCDLVFKFPLFIWTPILLDLI